MSRSLELGRAVVHCPVLNLELWLTTSITISPLQNQDRFQQFKSAQIIDILSSGDFWVCRGPGLHAKLNLTLRDEPLSSEELQGLSEALIQAPVWDQVLLQLSTPRDALNDPGVLRFDIQYNNAYEPQKEVRRHRIFSQVPVKDLKPPEVIETVFLDSVRFSMQMVDSRPSGHIASQHPKTATGMKELTEFVTKPSFSFDGYKSDVLGDQLNLPSAPKVHPYQNDCTGTRSDQRKRKRSATENKPSSSLSLFNQHDSVYTQSIAKSMTQFSKATSLGRSDATGTEALIDGALRLSVYGSFHGRSSCGLRVKANTFRAGLADVAPALWRPGYLLALSQKSHFLEVVSRSIDQIAHIKACSPSLKQKMQRLELQSRKDLDEDTYDQVSCSNTGNDQLTPTVMGLLWQQLQRNSVSKSAPLQPFVSLKIHTAAQPNSDDMLEEMMGRVDYSHAPTRYQLDDESLAVSDEQDIIEGF